MNHDQIGELTFYCDDLNQEISIKGYLSKLLLTVWKEAEGFSGKRPFGNSGWKYDIYICLVKNGLVAGALDEDGYVKEIDEDSADALIYEIIEGIGGSKV